MKKATYPTATKWILILTGILFLPNSGIQAAETQIDPGVQANDGTSVIDRVVPGQLLVRFKTGIELSSIPARLRERGIEPLELNRFLVDNTDPDRTTNRRGRFVRGRLVEGTDVSSVLQELREDPDVAWAEPNGLYRAFVPNDPECIDDSNPEGNTFWDQWGYYRTRDDQAWDARPQSSQLELVRFAVLDTGLDFDHPDGPSEFCSGPGCIWANELELFGIAGVDDDGNGYVDDLQGIDFVRSEQGTGDVVGYDGDPNVYASDPDGSCGDGLDNDGNGLRDELVYHGTHVAGIALAITNNNTMFAGHAWQAELMVIRVLSPEGWGSWADIAEGIEYAADNGAHVINLSLGGGFSQAVADACSHAHSLGCVIVAAVGNDGEGSVHYPARLSETIAVGASDPADTRASFSNWGSEIDVVAPGVRIFANAVTSVWEGQGNNTVGDPTYYWANGTSQATPMVAALASNLRSLFGLTYDNEAVRCRIRDTARDLSGTWDGAGLIDAAAATTPVAIGSCCLDEACIVSDEDCCISSGGVYLDDSPCDPGACETTTVESRPAPTPSTDLLLFTVAPNPSPGLFTLSYQLAEADDVRLSVFDASGRCRADLDLGAQVAGQNRFAWNGLDRLGRSLPAGQYYLKLETHRITQTLPVQILR